MIELVNVSVVVNCTYDSVGVHCTVTNDCVKLSTPFLKVLHCLLRIIYRLVCMFQGSRKRPGVPLEKFVAILLTNLDSLFSYQASKFKYLYLN
jgi:hypothetical protein